MNSVPATSLATAAAWHPPKEINFAPASLELDAPPACVGELVNHNELVATAAASHRQTLGELATFDPLTSTAADLVSRRTIRDATILEALRELHEHATRASKLAAILAHGWREHHELLLKKLESVESATLKILRRLHPADVEARLKGRLADVADVVAARAAASEARSAASSCEREGREKLRVVAAVEAELVKYCEHLAR
jgi:hypothetical protein